MNNNHKTYKTNPTQEKFMMECSENFTCKEMAKLLGIEVRDVCNFYNRKGLMFKPARQMRRKKVVRHFVHIAYTPQSPKNFNCRPPAVYGNIQSPYGLASQLHRRK